MTLEEATRLLHKASAHLATHRPIMDWDNKLMCSRCGQKDDDLLLDCKESPSYSLLCEINAALSGEK
jgi:hypothetical protein